MEKHSLLEKDAIHLVNSGIFLPVPRQNTPCTVRRLLEDVLRIPHAYVEGRIQTLLLNGLAVDNLDTAVLRSGARLALSAAMPGVAGATLRRDGHYAPMRKSITLDETPVEPGQEAPFWLELRCFNDIAREQAVHLVRHGLAAPAENFGAGLRPLAEALPASLPAPPRPDLLWLRLTADA